MIEKSNFDSPYYISAINRTAEKYKSFWSSGYDFTNADHVLLDEIVQELKVISSKFRKDLENVKYDLWKVVNKMRKAQIEDEEFEIDSLVQDEYGEPLDTPKDDD